MPYSHLALALRREGPYHECAIERRRRRAFAFRRDESAASSDGRRPGSPHPNLELAFGHGSAADLADHRRNALHHRSFWSWPLALAAVVVIATQQHALFILSHDAAHYRLFDHRGLNDLVGRACAAAAGLSMCTYRVIHRLHHNHLYGPQDPDMALHGGYPRGKWYLARKLLKDLSGLTAAKTYAYFFGNPAQSTAAESALQPLADTSLRLRAAARSDQKLVIALQLALPVLMLWLGGWPGLALYLVLWVVPAVTVLQAILRLRAVCEHGAVADLSSPLTAARSHLPTFTGAWLLARPLLFPHHVNYHVEHHLYPAVPHYNLRGLHHLLASRGLLAGSEIHTIGQTLRKIFDEPVRKPMHSVGDMA